MVTTLASTIYTDKDFLALQTRLRGLMQSIFPEWPINDSGNYGNILLDLFAYVGDVNNFYNDTNFQESSVKTAQLLQTLLDKAFGLDVILPLQEAALVDEEFTITNPRDVNVLIPKGSIVETTGEDIVSFQTLTDQILLAGATTITISMENSSTQTETVYPSGEGFWTVWLSYESFLRIVSITDELGNLWTEQPTLVNSGSTDRHFTVTVNSAGNAQLRFGNGVLGKVPDTPLVVIYTTGGGSAGNVVENTLRSLQTDIVDENGESVAFEVNNPAEASGGNDRISVEEARQLIPDSFRAQKRSVGEGDTEAHALLVPGVARAISITSDQDPAMEEALKHVRIVPEGGGLPSQALKDAVLEQVTVTYPQTSNIFVFIFDPIYKSVDIVAKVFRNEGYTTAETGTLIRSDLTTFFALNRPDGEPNTGIQFGGQYRNSQGSIDPYLPFSDVYNVIRDNKSARKLGTVTLNNNTTDVFLLYGEFPVLGSVTLIDGDTGEIF